MAFSVCQRLSGVAPGQQDASTAASAVPQCSAGKIILHIRNDQSSLRFFLITAEPLHKIRQNVPFLI